MQNFFSKEASKILLKTNHPNISELQKLHFSFTNPLFGLLLLLILLLLSRTWGLKKAFSYCLLASSILCLATGIGAYLEVSIEGATITYADIVRAIAIFLVVVLAIYYAFVKSE